MNLHVLVYTWDKCEQVGDLWETVSSYMPVCNVMATELCIYMMCLTTDFSAMCNLTTGMDDRGN